jgi:hypothetical protein
MLNKLRQLCLTVVINPSQQVQRNMRMLIMQLFSQ